MTVISDTSGTDRLIAHVRQAYVETPWMTREVADKAGQEILKLLRDRAPHGRGGGSPPPGDAGGSLADSFHVNVSEKWGGVMVDILTSQPTKLKYVTEGTGIYGKLRRRIVPRVKRALWWQGAEHPVRSVRGQPANDFIKPVLAQAETIVEREMDDFITKMNGMMGGD